MRKYFIILIVILVSACCHQQQIRVPDNPRIKRLIDELNSSEWPTVYHSKDTLESLAHEAIPFLVENLNQENRYVKLQNAFDLIYPGATEFYGSGWVVDYDIDWLTIRAGWVLEEITFENFGFKESKIIEDNLIELAKDSIKYLEYIKTGRYDFKVSPDRIAELKTMVKRVNKWWENNSNDWSRLKAITQALISNDVQCQFDALQYLRNSDLCIEGLSREYFEKQLRPIVKNLTNSSDENIRDRS